MDECCAMGCSSAAGSKVEGCNSRRKDDDENEQDCRGKMRKGWCM